MSLICTAGRKGGCGKTTTALLLATELALDGYRVALLDCDLNQHATRFHERTSIPRFNVLPAVGEPEILPTLRAAFADHDLVFVDLPGGTTTLAFKAMARANFVLIPSRLSLLDARDGAHTMAQVDDAAEMAGRTVPRALLWTCVPSTFESRAAREVRETVQGRGLPIFETALMDRSAYRAMHHTGQVPRQLDPKSSASKNVTAVTRELLAKLQEQVTDVQAAG